MPKPQPTSLPPDQKPSKWRYFFVSLGVLQAVGIALVLFMMWWAARQAESGVSGTEFIALILYVTVVPFLAIISLASLVGLPIYIIRHKPRGRWRNIATVSLVVSAVLVLQGVYAVHSITSYQTESSEALNQELEQKRQAFKADNAKPEITTQEAVSLLRSCNLKGFYYTAQTNKREPENGGWGELSSTGVVLTRIDGRPYRISIADRLIPELVPIAREAQKNCPDLQFWHDGGYEQYKDGQWYFRDQVVHE